MVKINSKQARQFSRIGSRGTYGLAMLQLVKDNERVYALTADLGGSSGMQRLMAAYPERFLNVGIAEQNLIGFASGLAKEGIIPFASSFAPFITLRCLDQIKMNLGYMKQNVKLVGLGSGFGMGELGNSHYGLEDVAVLRSIPNMTIIEPADCSAIIKSVYAAAEYDGPVYIRLTGATNVPVVYKEDFDFEIGKSICLREGEDVAIIATGSMVSVSVEAAKHLEVDGISCSVYDMHTVKPLDENLLKYLAEENIPVVTIEEHSVVGGLGSAVSEYYSIKGVSIHQKIIGVPDKYGKTASYSFQLGRYGLTSTALKDNIIEFLN